MSDALMGVTEIDAASLADISAAVQNYLQQVSFLLPTVTNYSQFAVKGAKSVDLPRSGGFTVNDKSENTAVDSQIITYAVDTITFNKHKVVQFLNEEIAENQAKIALTQDQLLKATKDIARVVDQDIIAQLKDVSTASPKHDILFASTGDDIIAKGDVLAARKLLQAQFINPRECFMGISSEKENELLNIGDFIDASKYGSSEPIMNGEIGKIYGIRVIVHEDFEDFMCTWHPTAVGYAFQRLLTVQNQPDLANLAMRWSLDQRYGVEALDVGTGGTKRSVFTDSTA